MRTTLIIALLLLSNLFLRADSIPDIVKRTKAAIVKIVAMHEQGSPTELGTGFFISPDGLVVTNFHVIRSAASLAAVNNNGALFLFAPPDRSMAGISCFIDSNTPRMLMSQT